MPTWTKEQNDAIYKSGTNIIVSAGAGSGKTAVLTARVLNKLNQGIHVNELLILTFTKAAAGEMKERIRKNIKKYSELKEELTLLDTAYITTFDSFALSIVKKYHYLLNISSKIKITDDTILEILRKDTLRKVMDIFYEEKRIDFINFINEFCVKNDTEIYNSILSISKSLEKKINKMALLENYNEIFMSLKKINQYISEFEILLLEKQNIVKNKIEELKLVAPQEYITKVLINLNALLNAKNIDEMVSLKSSKLPPLPKNSEEEVKVVKENLNESLKELLKLLEYGNTEVLKQDLVQMKKYVSVICEILVKYFNEFEMQKKEKEYYDFNDIAFLAINLLKKNSNVCEEIKNQFKEIMIDEYQDTNDLQEEFIHLISNNNVYMVGDIKQSIYRFRNANPYLFKKKYDDYRLKKNGEKIDLLKNFRSRKEVLQNINQIFNIIMDDDLGGANYLEEHQMVFGNNAYIEQGSTQENYHMDLLTYQYEKELGFSKEEIEIFAIGNDIKNKISKGYQLYDKDSSEIHKATYQDFVILMDRSTCFELYKKIFNYLQIPITLYKDETFNDSTCFFVIKNLIKLLISYNQKNFNKDFKFSFTSIARSFLFEYDDQKIYDIVINNNWYNNSLFQTIKIILEDFSTKTIVEIIEDIYKVTKIYHNIIKIGDVEENMTILNYIRDLAEKYQEDSESIEDFFVFLTRIDKDEMQIKYTNVKSTNESVKIMTIHKSKGLEYPICYFSGLYKSFNILDLKERFLYDEKYGIITALKNEGLYHCFMKELVKKNYLQEEISEKLRLFYVAATRAKEKMIFVLPNNLHDNKDLNLELRLKSKSLADFLYNIWNHLKNYQTRIDLTKLNLTKKYLISLEEQKFETEKNKPIEVKELELQETKKEKQSYSKKIANLNNIEDYKNIELGLKMHDYLENINFKNPKYQMIPDDFLREKIKKFINIPLIQDNLEAEIYKEYEFIDETNTIEHHGIIDLMIVSERKIIMIDYKLSNLLDNTYVEQIKGYQKYIEKKFKKRVEPYLYSILCEQLITIENKHSVKT